MRKSRMPDACGSLLFLLRIVQQLTEELYLEDNESDQQNDKNEK